jgi:GNAT superfamily N-acetyltransferase
MCEFRSLAQEDIPSIVSAFAEIGWNKPALLFEKYLEEQENNMRSVWVAFDRKDFIGYVTLKWQSDYLFFKTQNIPEINDLNVLPQFRRQGIGTHLLGLAETEAQKRSTYIGLGVGLYADYGEAQKLYIKQGYIPDGHGVTYKYLPVVPGKTYPIDNDLILWFIKKVKS